MPPRLTGNSAPVQAGIYCRISKADEGDYVKTDDQERICREHAERLGWEVAEGVGHPFKSGVYTDHSKSAWQKNRNRPAWNRMLADVNAGRINGIIVYHGDRLARRPEDLADLMRLSDSKGVKLASPSGTYDLDKNRLELWVRTAFAEEESQRLSERRKAQYERWRREGKTRPGGQGGRAFGFASDGVTQVPAEAEAIREMADRILAGDSAYAVGRDLTERGFRTPSGLPLTSAVVIYVLKRPRTAGLMPDGENRAAWDPVLDRQTWEQVMLLLAARKESKFGHATTTRRWLLSSIALCGACGGTMTAGYARRNVARGIEAVPGYYCRNAGCWKVGRKAEYLDAYISRRVVNLLNDPRQPQDGHLPVLADDAGEWASLGRERADVERAVTDYSATAGRLPLLMARLDQIDSRMAELRERESDDARLRLLARYRDITMEQFEAEPLEVRRALVAASFRITVLPASVRGRGGFRTEDVVMEPLG